MNNCASQIVKTGELLSATTPLPYAVGCVLSSLLIGGITFGAQPRVVEGINTALTAMLLLGFGALILSTLLSTSVSAAVVTERLAFAKWASVLPTQNAPWSVPIFLNLLCFGQSVPFITARMARPVSELAAQDAQLRRKTQRATLSRTRTAVLLGARRPAWFRARCAD